MVDCILRINEIYEMLFWVFELTAAEYAKVGVDLG